MVCRLWPGGSACGGPPEVVRSPAPVKVEWGDSESGSTPDAPAAAPDTAGAEPGALRCFCEVARFPCPQVYLEDSSARWSGFPRAAAPVPGKCAARARTCADARSGRRSWSTSKLAGPSCVPTCYRGSATTTWPRCAPSAPRPRAQRRRVPHRARRSDHLSGRDRGRVAGAAHSLCRGAEQHGLDRGCVLAYGDPHGWEAAVFDHFQALVIALCAKLRLGQTHAAPTDTIGGSTFGFEVWPGHPEYDNALGLLGRLRAQGSELRQRVAAYNETHSAPPDEKRRVVTYVGQSVIGPDSPGNLPATTGIRLGCRWTGARFGRYVTLLKRCPVRSLCFSSALCTLMHLYPARIAKSCSSGSAAPPYPPSSSTARPSTATALALPLGLIFWWRARSDR